MPLVIMISKFKKFTSSKLLAHISSVQVIYHDIFCAFSPIPDALTWHFRFCDIFEINKKKRIFKVTILVLMTDKCLGIKEITKKNGQISCFLQLIEIETNLIQCVKLTT